MMGEGTVNDDQAIIDAINSVVDDYSTGDTKAPRILTALRSAGFHVFRPEDCERFSLGHCCEKHRRHYLLVPADSGGSG